MTIVTVTITTVLGCPTGVVAQAETAARVTASIAAGKAAPVHSDLGFTAPEWQIAVRARVSRHVAMEVFIDEWRHSTERVFLDVPLHGPSGIVGQIDRVRSETRYVARVVGWNTLVEASAGRVTVFGGGGPGYMTFGRTFLQTVSGCQAVQPRACDDRETRHDSGSFSVQAVGGVEFAVTRHVAAFGQFQFPVPLQDPGSSHASTTAGVRVRLW